MYQLAKVAKVIVSVLACLAQYEQQHSPLLKQEKEIAFYVREKVTFLYRFNLSQKFVSYITLIWLSLSDHMKNTF